jgi:hypothetical protein
MLSACVISSYRIAPQSAQPAPPHPAQSTILYVRFNGFDKAPKLRESVVGYLRKQSIDVRLDSAPTEHAKRLDIYLSKLTLGGGEEGPLMAASISLFLVPVYWSGQAGTITFTLVSDDYPNKVYTYLVFVKSTAWIVYVPLFWINELLDQPPDVAMAAARQFVADAAGELWRH